MFEKCFYKTCTALVGTNGRALSGEMLEVAEAALTEARRTGCKIWSDRNGYVYTRSRGLFAPAVQLTDANGNPVRVCGRQVPNKAKFCSKCGAPAPGGWWRCGGCGKHIGNESKTCPHCGREQNIQLRGDLADGIWKKPEDIFAERFEFPDVAPLLGKGLNVQESQCAILLEGGAVTETLGPGFYKMPDIETSSDEGTGHRSLVLVDSSEFVLPVCVGKVRTSDDIAADLHLVIALRFSLENAKDFMCNLMGSSLLLHADTITASLGYDEIAHAILQTVDSATQDFCNTVTVSELFKDADIRLRLENHIGQVLIRSLGASGLKFVRLKEAEFESEVFEKLREMSGQVEAKRREIEFMMRADELANDATRREALNEFEMEEYVNQLAHEKNIKDELRKEELEHLRAKWALKKQIESQSTLNEAERDEQLRQAENDEEIRSMRHKEELARRIAAQKNSVEYMRLEAQIQEIKLEIEKKKTIAEQEATEAWLEIKQKRKAEDQRLQIEMMKASCGMDMRALIISEKDPEKRSDLLKLYEMEMQSKMTPELLLAAGAARGNPAAAEALSTMNREQRDAIERSMQDNKETYEKILSINKDMFTTAMECLAKNSASSGPTTQIIK